MEYIFSKSIQCHSKQITSIKFSYDEKRIFSSSIDGSVSCSDVKTCKVLFNLQGCGGAITNFLLIENNLESFIFTCSKEGKIFKWNINERRLEDTYEMHDGIINHMYLSKNQKIIYSCSMDGSLSKFNIDTKRQDIKFYQEDNLRNFFVMENSNFIISQSDNKINLY